MRVASHIRERGGQVNERGEAADEVNAHKGILDRREHSEHRLDSEAWVLGQGADGMACGVTRRDSHLADQGAELCGAQVSIDATENGDCDHNVTQNAAQIVKRVDANCRSQRPRIRDLGTGTCSQRKKDTKQDQLFPESSFS